jgi:hypothetical protein
MLTVSPFFQQEIGADKTLDFSAVISVPENT